MSVGMLKPHVPEAGHGAPGLVATQLEGGGGGGLLRDGYVGFEVDGG